MNAVNYNGAPMSPRHLRVAGWMMVAAGILLTSMMGSLTAGFACILLFPDRFNGITFEGSSNIAAGVMALFLFLLTFGIAATFAGIRQVRTGVRDLRIVKFASIVAIVITILGTAARFLID